MSAPNDSKHYLTALHSQFVHEEKFDFLVL